MHCKNWVGSDHLIQIQHVLNGCKCFKNQGRYLWRHIAILDYIGTMLEKNLEAFRCYLDVPGRRTHDDGTVPDQLLQTSAKPDIFILDQRDHLERYCFFNHEQRSCRGSSDHFFLIVGPYPLLSKIRQILFITMFLK